MGLVEAAVVGILLLLFLGAVPAWPHSRRWGYLPSGGLALLLIIAVIAMLLMRQTS